MLLDEGYIKFQAHWCERTAPLTAVIADLNMFRQACFDNKWIGAYDDGIGYGNISQRHKKSEQFWITGSATGNLKTLSNDHFSLVSEVDISKNILWCEGPIIASSESMSHAVIYQELPWVNAVIHIHHLRFWEHFLNKAPTTNIAAKYGTPEMANSIITLIQETDLIDQQFFIMSGHREGVFSFGKNLADAFDVLERAFRTF